MGCLFRSVNLSDLSRSVRFHVQEKEVGVETDFSFIPDLNCFLFGSHQKVSGRKGPTQHNSTNNQRQTNVEPKFHVFNCVKWNSARSTVQNFQHHKIRASWLFRRDVNVTISRHHSNATFLFPLATFDFPCASWPPLIEMQTCLFILL